MSHKATWCVGPYFWKPQKFIIIIITSPLHGIAQLNEQQKAKAVRVSGTDSTINSGLVGVQIGTALLVKVSVFRDEVWIAYSLSVELPELWRWWQQSAAIFDKCIPVSVEC